MTVKITLFSSEDWAVETASIQTKPELRGVEELTVKIMLFSSVRAPSGLRFCRRGFNRRLISKSEQANVSAEEIQTAIAEYQVDPDN